MMRCSRLFGAFLCCMIVHALHASLIELRLPQNILNQWKPIEEKRESNGLVLKFIPMYESEQSSCGAMQIEYQPYHYVLKRPRDVHQFIEKKISWYKKQCQNMNVTLVESLDTQATFWCSAKNCQGQEKIHQHHLFTVFKGQLGFNAMSVTQTSKIVKLEESLKQDMWSMVRQASIVEPEVSQFA